METLENDIQNTAVRRFKTFCRWLLILGVVILVLSIVSLRWGEQLFGLDFETWHKWPRDVATFGLHIGLQCIVQSWLQPRLFQPVYKKPDAYPERYRQFLYWWSRPSHEFWRDAGYVWLIYLIPAAVIGVLWMIALAIWPDSEDAIMGTGIILGIISLIVSTGYTANRYKTKVDAWAAQHPT